MAASVYWIQQVGAGRLGIIPRPRGGDWLEDDLRALAEEGVKVVVSLLTREEIDELGLAREGAVCETNGMVYRSFPIADRAVPASMTDVQSVVNDLHASLSRGDDVVVHCRAGIGRSALLAGAILVTEGIDAEAALERIALARGRSVPDTEEQCRWLVAFERYVRRGHGA